MRTLLQVLCAVIVCTVHTMGQESMLKFEIDKTWNGEPANHKVTLMLSETPEGDIKLGIIAPYFGDPAPTGTPGLPFMGLWDYEVVQAFFLNDDDQYVEIEVGPHGQHIVLLMNGERHTIRHSLPLNVTTNISGEIWTGMAIIPKQYFPPKITKFNGYAINGVGEARKYWSLYPTDGSTENPDFHNLKFFQPIDLSVIDSEHNTRAMSTLWESAIEGIIRYTVSRQWNSGPSVVAPSEYSLQGFQWGVELNYTIRENTNYPFEFTVFVFENDDGEALKLKMFSDEKYEVEFIVNRKERIGNDNKFNLNYLVEDKVTLKSNETLRKGSIFVPPKYFPKKVSLLNIYALFGLEVRAVDALEPIHDENEATDPRPNLDNLRHFTTIDFDHLVESNDAYSPFWKELLQSATNADMTTVIPEEISESTSELSVQEDVSSERVLSITISPIQEEEQKMPLESITELQQVTEETDRLTTETPTFLETKKDKILETEKTPVLEETTELSNIELTTVLSEEELTTVNEKLFEKRMSEENKQKIAIKLLSLINPTTVVPEVQEETTITSNLEDNEVQGTVEETTVQVQLIEDTTLEPTDQQEEIATTVGEELLSDQNSEVTSSTQPPTVLETGGAIPVPEGFMPETKVNQLDRPLAAFLSQSLKQVPDPLSDRETFKRRFEETEKDKNTLPFDLKFLLNTEKKFEDYEEELLIDQPVDYLDIESSGINLPEITPNIEEALDNVFNILSQDQPTDQDLESALDTLVNINNLQNSSDSSDNQDDISFPNMDIDPLEEFIIHGLLPPPHPFCMEEGLVADSHRCQVFYECVLENGSWEVYNWRCKRGYYYDPVKVACIRGYC